jgi:hypothetical protein
MTGSTADRRQIGGLREELEELEDIQAQTRVQLDGIFVDQKVLHANLSEIESSLDRFIESHPVAVCVPREKAFAFAFTPEVVAVLVLMVLR